MVRIRFRRVGLKGQPSYRLVVTDQRSPRDGRFIENIGFHNPRTIPSTDLVDEARALYWLSKGAQPSKAVDYLFKRTGTLARFERLRKGEAIEALVAEATANPVTVSAKTAHDAPGAGQGNKKNKEA